MSKTSMGKTLIKIIWPFVKDVILPMVKEFIKAVVVKYLAKFLEKMHNEMDKRFNNRFKDATEKANEADENASKATTDCEKEKYENIAKVWREVADNFRVENEELKAKLETLTTEAKEKIIIETENMKPKIDDKDGSILIENKKK
ncbi:MAG: hypothetical protein PHQ90_09410 [Sulfuricurvum sp.]|uniref:hypothetical protein n=1 Tax=Sulfuricurvum sp. TaxID=2025608 RepID=UPI002616DA87|nr:hypothetical protein [Sulfuricurvum sp.]MDD2369508.1 hypothetical protein [Sulfuricurvum sp.]MDD5117008.1 hypothetical protein [Sulfuricurvum sp.]